MLASKRMLLERAVARDSVVLAYHFEPFPRRGHVGATASGWRWEPLGAPSP